MYQEAFDHREPGEEEKEENAATQKKYRNYAEYVFCLLFGFFDLWRHPYGSWLVCIEEYVGAVILCYFVLAVCKYVAPFLFEKVDKKTQNWKVPGIKLFCALLFVAVGWFTCTKSTKWYAEKASRTVYITRTGDCYHTKNCPTLDGTGILLSADREMAEDYGYQPCTQCNP